MYVIEPHFMKNGERIKKKKNEKVTLLHLPVHASMSPLDSEKTDEIYSEGVCLEQTTRKNVRVEKCTCGVVSVVVLLMVSSIWAV